jgi:hypothetical protein
MASEPSGWKDPSTRASASSTVSKVFGMFSSSVHHRNARRKLRPQQGLSLTVAPRLQDVLKRFHSV